MNAAGRPVKDRTGERFGKLVVVARAHRAGSMWHWVCRCDCGAETTVRINALTTGNTRSCGCLQTGGGQRPAQPRPLRRRAPAFDADRLLAEIEDLEYL